MLIAISLVLLGLTHVGYPHRGEFDPAARSNDSDYIPGRGFPLAWAVTDSRVEMSLRHRISPGGFLNDFIVFLLPTVVLALCFATWRPREFLIRLICITLGAFGGIAMWAGLGPVGNTVVSAGFGGFVGYLVALVMSRVARRAKREEQVELAQTETEDPWKRPSN